MLNVGRLPSGGSMKFLTTIAGKVFPFSGRQVHIPRAGIMEYWDVGMMGKAIVTCWKNGKEQRSEIAGQRSVKTRQGGMEPKRSILDSRYR